MSRILIVDDEKRIRRIYRDLLASFGFLVEEAATADQANEIVKHEKVDLVLLDIKMPEAGGDSLFEVMSLFHRDMKVIVTSVYPLDVQRRMVAGAHDYYDKSQGIRVLLTKIRQVLDN